MPGWNVDGSFEVNPNGDESVDVNNLRVWCGSFNEHPWIDQRAEGTPFNTWIMNTTNGTAAKFLTPYPDKKVQINDLGWTYFMTDTPADVDRMIVKTYDSAGVIIATFSITNVVPYAVPLEYLTRMASASA